MCSNGRNRLQISGNTEDVMGHDDLHERIRSFGWHVIDVKDGNDIDQLNAAFEEAKTVKGKPTAVIANTVKGCGSSVMENKATGITRFQHRKNMIRSSRILQQERRPLFMNKIPNRQAICEVLMDKAKDKRYYGALQRFQRIRFHDTICR